jgi:hypothetical protein
MCFLVATKKTASQNDSMLQYPNKRPLTGKQMEIAMTNSAALMFRPFTKIKMVASVVFHQLNFSDLEVHHMLPESYKNG